MKKRFIYSDEDAEGIEIVRKGKAGSEGQSQRRKKKKL